MNLTEYLNQTEIKRQYNVTVDLSEISIIMNRGYGTEVTIPSLGTYTDTDGRLMGHKYFIKKGSTLFMTMDGDGNPLNVSCFKLEKPL